MANTNNFNIIGLDFDEAKASLQAFLQSQDTLKDYNFDGSVLSTVLDVLAYNTHYQAFYANMVANEMFLDSAVLRPSVVSHAKTLGYVPTSRRAAKAVLTVAAPGASENTYLARGSEFVGTDLAGTQYRFVLLDTVYANAATQSFDDIEVYEGTLRRMSYAYDPNKKTASVLLIPNDKIDTSTIKVRIKASATDNTGLDDVWTYSESYIDLTPTSKVFFLQERETGMYELFFGDGFLGQQPEAGNIVVVEYLETNGDAGNAISRFTTSIAGLGAITANSPSSGGTLEESVSKIKFLAPRFYQSQSRAVTEDDYSAAVLKDYPAADSVYVYGGETVNPPQYGKVFIAVKPRTGTALTAEEKISLSRTLRENRSVVTVTPEIVDPDYIDLVVDSLVTYDPSVTTIGIGTLKALVVAYIYTYSASLLENFGSNFYLSKLTQGINTLNSAILGNQTSILLRKTTNLSKLVNSKGLALDFKNPFYHPHDGHSSVVTTTAFSHYTKDGVLVANATAADDGYGKLNIVTTDLNGVQTVIYSDIGTVDYANGTIKFTTSFNPNPTNTVASPLFTVTVKPENTDVFVFENNIIRVNRGYADSVSVSLQTQTNRKQNLKA
jgi:hypothetical protein